MRVLFLCTGNSARSQMAEALLQERGRGDFIAGSAGTFPAPRVHPDAIALLASRGIRWDGRRPKSLDDVLASPWDVVITVCDNARESCPIFPRAVITAHWGVDDPADVADLQARRNAFAHAADVLAERIDRLIAMPREVRQSPDFQECLRAIAPDREDG